MLKNKLVLMKGAGDFASGSIRRLHLAGAKIVCTELSQPLTIRRLVSFSEAMFTGSHTVEGVTAAQSTPESLEQCFTDGKIPILNDPETQILQQRKFDIVIDARMAKTNLGTKITEAPIVISLGPGFEAGTDCHAVVETLAGHNLGRVLYEGSTAPDTGTPAPPEVYLNPVCEMSSTTQTTQEPCCFGFDVNELVLRAPCEGVFTGAKKIGELVKKNEVIGRVNETEIVAPIDGVLRGLIHDGVRVTEKLKIGDVDPSCDISRVYHISEKSNAIAGGVLEACLYLLNKDL